MNGSRLGKLLKCAYYAIKEVKHKALAKSKLFKF